MAPQADTVNPTNSRDTQAHLVKTRFRAATFIIAMGQRRPSGTCQRANPLEMARHRRWIWALADGDEMLGPRTRVRARGEMAHAGKEVVFSHSGRQPIQVHKSANPKARMMTPRYSAAAIRTIGNDHEPRKSNEITSRVIVRSGFDRKTRR